MKTKFFLAAGLLVTAMGFSQNATVAYPEVQTTTGEQAGSGGMRSVHIGDQAGSSATSINDRNVFVGKLAGNNTAATSILNGYSNSFVGFRAGLENITGFNNTYIGAGAGRENTIGERNTFIGEASGVLSTGGKYNAFIGSQSGYSFLDGEYNVFVGTDSGYNNGSGSANTFLGYQSGYNTTGSLNVFIGNKAGFLETGSDRLYIANSNTPNPLIYGEFDNNIVKFNAEKVGIGYVEDGNGDAEDYGFPDLSSLTLDVDYRLFVRGGIWAQEVRVRTDLWADYVFADDYKLMPLTEVEQYITDNGHLPNMPSAKEVEEDGIALGNMVKLQQEKIEELTLHLIEQEKEMEALKAQVQLLLNKQ